MLVLKNRMIAMLDVLGFSQKIKNPDDLVKITEEYSRLISEAKVTMFRPNPVAGSPSAPEANFEFGQFVFDTIVLVSYEINVKSVCNFISAICIIMENFFERGYPLRGAITKGDFCVHSESNIFLSDRFKDLKKIEDTQEWSGCVVLVDVEDVIIDSIFGIGIKEIKKNSPLQSDILLYYNIPTKKSCEDCYLWCINWKYFLSDIVLRDGMERMKVVKDKFDNTNKYVEYISSLPDDKIILPEGFYPAHIMRCMKSRQNCRISFADMNGEGVDPGCDNWTIMLG